jgi:hypothetical protein
VEVWVYNSYHPGDLSNLDLGACFFFLMKNNFVPLRLDLIFQMQGNEAYRCNHRYITLDNLFFREYTVGEAPTHS